MRAVMRGRFVTLEGIDGSGKSSALRRIATELGRQGTAVWATREETDGPTGEWVRRAVSERWPPMATALLFAADRALHVGEIRRRLAAGEHVVCDRFLHSTIAYQSVTMQGVVPDVEAWVRGLHEGWCPMPDKVLLFDSDPRKAVARAQRRGDTTPYESVAFLEGVRANYLRLAAKDRERFVVLDADRPMEDLAADALQAVRTALTA